MENQPPLKKGGDEDDRISQLPQHILLHHILYHLPQFDAVRTSILSKSWRYLGSTRPKFEFRHCFWEGKKARNMSLTLLEDTLQRYFDQKLSLEELVLWMQSDSKSISLLEQWIPLVLMNLGVKKFTLSAHFSLPSVVFQAELLTELFLQGCKLDQINNNCINIKLRVLKRLSLHNVWIEEETLEKILSSCPLIQHLVMNSCEGLSTTKVNKVPNLKHFDFDVTPKKDDIIASIVIEDAPSLKTICIRSCQNWFQNNYFFPCLKSLYLWKVHLPDALLDNLSSNNCPCLQVLELHFCTGFGKFFKLSNRSIKRLIIDVPYSPIKATIDAANMIYFEFRGFYLPSSISFATTPREWKSRIFVGYFNTDPTWYIKLNEFLKALSQSQISLTITRLCHLTNQDTFDGGGSSCEPVLIEQLCLRDTFDELPALLNRVFRTCRPRYISLNSGSEDKHESQLAESIWKTLVKKGKTRQCDSWQQDLEESSIQVSDKNTNEWHPVQDCALSNNQSIRFWLNWRDLS